MDASLLGGETSTDHLVLCNQEGFLPQPFLSNDYSTDSSSTQLTGGLGSGQNYGHPSYTFVNGQHQPPQQQHQQAQQPHYRQDIANMESEAAMGYFEDSAAGLYSQAQIQSPGPFTERVNIAHSMGAMPSFKHLAFPCNPFPETNTTSTTTTGAAANALGGFNKESFFMPNACRETGTEFSSWATTGHITSTQLNNESNMTSNHFAFSDFDPSMFVQKCPDSGAFPSLSELPLNMEPQTISCKTGLLEPTLTTTPASNWWRNNSTVAAAAAAVAVTGATAATIKEERQTITTTTGNERPSSSSVRNSETGNSSYSGSKARWKPNQKQLCLLEQHFRTGYTKATPELFLAVKEAGAATESQVSVWLKNRLARCKRYPDKETEPRSDETLNFETEFHSSAAMTGNKRERQDEAMCQDFSFVQSIVLDELAGILQSVDSEDIKGLARAIRSANHICCYGVSREGLAMKAFTINLHHLGFKAYYIGDTTTPPLSQGDLFLVSAGPSYYSTVSALALEAMRSGARVIAFTAHKTAPLPFAESVIRIASQTLPPCMPVMNRKLGGIASEVVSSLPDGRLSCMQMGASFEVALSLVLESLSVMIRKKLAISLRDVSIRRTNLS